MEAKSDDIRLLDEHTINQIAAGEVIENPASVVKELVENGLDAGATVLTILVMEGGLSLLQVMDNGMGIAEENLPKAFLRYGTSKLSIIDDLYRLDTMGFRGEALASIAAVAKVTLSTCRNGEGMGHSIIVEGGKASEIRGEALRVGTSVKVERLFYNAPVREQFLKSTMKETKTIVEIVEKLALSRPDVAFELLVDGRQVLKTRGNGNISELAGKVFSFEMGKGLKPIQGSKDGIAFHGLVGGEGQYRSNREHMHFFINRRYVRSRFLTSALEEVYRNRIPIGKHPVAIIYLEIPAYLVEVNIHPRKMEVRLSREEEIAGFLQSLVTQALLGKGPMATEADKTVSYPPLSLLDLPVAEGFMETQGNQTQLSFEREVEEGNNPFYPAEILGVFHDTYILADVRGELLVVDQHAAHERINFEKAEKEFQTIGFKSQMLMEPVLVNLSPSDYLKVLSHIDSIADHGVILEAFGEDAFLIRGLPLSIHGDEAGGRFLLQLTDRLSVGDDGGVRNYLLEKASCVRSVKAGQGIGMPELKALLYGLGRCVYPHTCPHGRPTYLKYRLEDLEKLFLRS